MASLAQKPFLYKAMSGKLVRSTFDVVLYVTSVRCQETPRCYADAS